MTVITSVFTVLILLIGWKIVCSQERRNSEDITHKKKDTFLLKDLRGGQNNPDMRLFLNNLLRYDNYGRPSESEHILDLPSRSKGTMISGDDPLALLTPGFHGSRGKRLLRQNSMAPDTKGKRQMLQRLKYYIVPAMENGFIDN